MKEPVFRFDTYMELIEKRWSIFELNEKFANFYKNYFPDDENFEDVN